MKSLILNIDFSPLSVVSAKRAITLAIKNKNIRVLEYYDVTFNSEKDFFEVPAVMLYEKFVKPPTKKSVSKRYILLRDFMMCQYCSQELDSKTASVDHVIPSSFFKNKNDANTWENLVACCIDCNAKKANKKPEDAGMKLIKQPKKPSSFLNLMPESELWDKYLS